MRYRLDQTFEHDGDWWRISAIGEGFAIATRCSIEGEPEFSSDIMRITK